MQTSTTLVKYAKFLAQIRAFFMNNDVLEVSTKTLLNYPTLDDNIDNIQVITNQKIKKRQYYLHTSPELAMKQLIAEGSGNIYQICKVFRDNEIGKRNFNEFTLLEYYLLDCNTLGLINSVLILLKTVGIHKKSVRFSYFEACEKLANINLNVDFSALKTLAKSHNLYSDFNNISDLQVFLFTHFVEPKLVNFEICIIYDYPQQQAALAKIKNGIAKRFEIYINGIEIANGYDELQNADDYQQRFMTSITKHNNQLPLNNAFLQALAINPLPPCAGVAIGLERLFTVLQSP